MKDGYKSMLAEIPEGPERDEFVEWFESRPPCVQALVRRFPLPCKVRIEGVVHYLLGYNEDDLLILSPIDPAEDYDGAMAQKVYVCASHLERAP